MKLLNQVRLEFREGTSDKVYEVDLCEVGPGQFVVNFRYGRRGSALRDGSKTPAPVSQAQAQQIFDALVAEKRGKGYSHTSGTTPVASPPPAARPGPAPPPAQPAPPPPTPPAVPPPAGTTPANDRDLEREWAQAAVTPCPLCGQPRRAFRVQKAGPNHGKLFYKCGDPECGSFEWVPLPVSPPTPLTPPPPSAAPPPPPSPPRPAAQDRTFVYRDASSHKFWNITRQAGGYMISFGKVGSKGQTQLKTFPDEAKAQREYDRIIAEKIANGYAETTPGSAAPAGPAAPALVADVDGPRERGVLARLSQGYSPPPPAATWRGGKAKKPWRLPRAIWRAGELCLREAEPLLLSLLEETRQRKARRRRNQFDRGEAEQLLGARSLHLPASAQNWSQTQWPESYTPPEDMILYSIAWALGRCGAESCVPALRGLRTETWEPLGRIATAALLMMLEGSARDNLIAELTARLPDVLRKLAANGPAADFQKALEEYLSSKEAEPGNVLYLLYQIDNMYVRPALLALLRAAPLRSAYFQPLRYIFKIAELRRDAEVFGILAHRFETGSAAGEFRVTVSVTQYQRNQFRPGTRSVSPFGKNTRHYLRLRIWRTLRKLGRLGDPDYVRMAAGVLLPFTDADADEPVVPARRGSGEPCVLCRFWAYNQILYRNSERYETNGERGWFLCRRSWNPRQPGPREEAFPELWQAHPNALLELLAGSRCEPVHRFAVKVLRACPEFCRQLPIPALVQLIEAPYEATQELGLELAVRRYDPAHPDHDLVLALANSGLPRARAQAREWIDWQRTHFTQDLPFLAALATSRQIETRLYARALLQRTSFTPEAVQTLIARVVALLHSFTAEEGERAGDVSRTLQAVFAGPLRTVGVAVILDLLAHPLPEVRQFAGELLLGHETFAAHPPEDVLLRLFQDVDASVRGVGVRLFGQLPDETLKQSLNLLVALSRHELPDFRANIRPVVKRLSSADPAFARRFAERLVEALLTPGAPEGVPSYTVRLLREDFQTHLGGIPKDTIWKLLQARSGQAQEAGGMLLAANVKPDDLSLAEIVKLASHDVLAVREAAWQMCRVSLPRLKQDMDTATRLVDARWEDSRQFAFGLLRDAFHREELSPAILVSLCDSVRPDVQQFGKEMITRLFAESDGPEYAIKLSEHPSASMQMFAANFLERYAGNNPERLRELTFYFQSVLSRVNQGRVAKARVFAFLRKAAQVSQESARVVAAILGRQSAIQAIGDRARAIEILTEIHAAFPEVAMPLRVVPVEVRHGV